MRLKLVLSFAAVVLVSILTFTWLMRQETARQVRMYMFRGSLDSDASLTEVLEEYYLQTGSWENVASILGTEMRGQGQMGGMRAGGGPPFGTQLLLADATGSVIYDSSGQDVGERLSILQRWQSLRLQEQGQTIGYLVASSAQGAGSETQLVERLNRAALTTAVIAGSLALVLGIFLAYRLIRPIQALTAAAERLSAGDLSTRVQTSGSDEIAVLALTFNQMAESLQKAESNRQAMTADIAHELRTPLSVQRAHLEALEDGIYPLELENLKPIYEQNLALNRLVEDLRTLALADAGQLQLDRAPSDLVRLTRRVLDGFTPRARTQQVSLAFSASESLPLLSLDSGRIEQVLTNLLSNALRHSPPGGTISVALETRDDQAYLTVRDEGSGIPPEAMGQVFDRFYRADRARTREDGGSGLGLAIARQLVEAHGGELAAANHPQGGAVFTLTLPLDLQGSL